MKISELIEELESIKNQFGDLPVDMEGFSTVTDVKDIVSVWHDKSPDFYECIEIIIMD